MFCVGDKIVHPMHGAGVIESIVDEKIGSDDYGSWARTSATRDDSFAMDPDDDDYDLGDWNPNHAGAPAWTRTYSEAEAREARRGTRFKEGKSDRTGVPMWEARDMSDRPTQRRRTGGRS